MLNKHKVTCMYITLNGLIVRILIFLLIVVVHIFNYYWRASVASETLTGVKQLKIGDVCIYVWTYVCHFVL